MGRCNISTLWVNKSGSDANNGSTALLSKLTIQAAATAAASNDTIVVGSGLYNEKVSFVSKNLTCYADGIVVIDGSNLSNGYLVQQAGNGYTIIMQPYTTGGLWVFQNNIGTGILQTNGTTAICTINNAIFLSNGQASGIVRTGGGGYGSTMTISNCVFSGFSTSAITYLSEQMTSLSHSFYNNTFYNNAIAIQYTGVSGLTTTYIYNNIFSTGTTSVSIPTTQTTLSYYNKNIHYGVTNLLIYQSNIYTTLPAVQALGYELNGVVGDPHFADPTNNVFYLTQQQALYPGTPQVGAYPYGFTRGANNDSDGKWHIIAGAGYDNTGWYNPDGNVTKNGTTGNLELSSGTSGVVWSPVIDTGIVGCKTTELDISAIQVWPTNMVDTTATDIRPNYQTVEVRASDTVFNQNDGVVAWNEVKSNMAFTAISGRYLQCRLTLRANDAGA